MATKKVQQRIEIRPPAFETIRLHIDGTAPLITHKFSEKMRRQIEEKQTAKDATSKKREPKDYRQEFENARYRAREGGWDGIPCGALRNSMIAACRTVEGLAMTKAKGAFFILPQGHDITDGTPLVRIIGDVKHDTRPVRLESGVADLRNRPRYDNWSAVFDVQYDADMVSASDVANLLARAGAQVGICEMRPQAPNSFGGDFGLFGVRESGVGRQPKPKRGTRVKAVAKKKQPRLRLVKAAA